MHLSSQETGVPLVNIILINYFLLKLIIIKYENQMRNQMTSHKVSMSDKSSDEQFTARSVGGLCDVCQNNET